MNPLQQTHEVRLRGLHAVVGPKVLWHDLGPSESLRRAGGSKPEMDGGKYNGFLQPDEIAALRRRWGLSQARLEDALGVGRKTVARWEAGRVLQSRALDNLLRAIDRFPAVLTFLSERQGVGVQPNAVWGGARPSVGSSG